MIQDIYILDPGESLKVILSNDGSGACPILDDSHKEKLNNAFSTYEFEIPADHADSPLIKKKDKVLFQDVEGKWLMFKIEEIWTGRTTSGEKTRKFYAETVALELLGNIIRPVTLQGVTQAQALDHALAGTRFERGVVDFAGAQTFKFTAYLTTIDFINKMLLQSTFNSELQIRFEFDGKRITRRLVDLIARRGRDKGQVIEYGKNLSGISKNESSKEIYTALVGVGPANEAGDLLTFRDLNKPDSPTGQDWVGDEEARQLYGVPQADGSKAHYFGVYTYSGDNQELTAEKLYTNTKAMLKKVVKPSDTYEISHIDLAKQTSLEDHELIVLGDGVNVRDFDLNPQILLYTRAVEVERSYVNPAKNKYVFGDSIEGYTNSEGSRLRDIEQKILEGEGAWRETGLKEVTDENFPDVIPAVPSVSATGGFKTIFLEWEFWPASYIAKYEVYGSETSGFAPAPANLLWEGKASGFAHDAGNSKTFFYKVRAVNTRGSAGSFSQQVSASTVKIMTDEMLFGSVNADILADLAVTAGKLADGSVTTPKMADLAVDNPKLAALAVDAAKLADGAVTTLKIFPDAVTNEKIADLAVQAGQLAAGAVLEGKLGDLAVTAAKLAAGAVTDTKIANLAVGNAKLAALAVDAAKLADDAVTNAKIGPAAVNSAEIADSAVLTGKLAALAVDATKLGNGAVTDTKILDGAVTNLKIGNGAVNNAKLANLAVDAAKLADGAVINTKIANLAVGNAKLDALAVDAAKLADGAVTNGKLGNLAVTNGKLAALAVDAAKLAEGAVIAGKIANAAVGNAQLEALAVDAAKLAAGAVTNGKIADLAIDNAKLAALAVDAAKLADSAVTTSKIANLAVGSAAIANAAITNAKLDRASVNKIVIGNADIANAAIKAAQIDALAVGNAAIANGAITNAKIGNLAVDTAQLADAAITSAKIENLAVGSAAIANLAVTTGKIANLAVDTAQLADAAITSAKVENLAVGNAAIANGAITNAKIGNLAVGTAQLADASITNAKIANLAVGSAAIQDLAVTNAKINDLHGGKLTANSVTVSKLVVTDFTNLCENPDFEGDSPGAVPRGWTGGLTADISAFQNGNGSARALQLKALVTGNRDAYCGELIPVTPGQRFYVEGEYRFLNNAGTGSFRLGFRTYGPDKAGISWHSPVSTNTKATSFTKLGAAYEVPAGVSYIQIWASFSQNGEATNELYLDNIRINRMASGELIVDGAVTADKLAANSITATNGAIANLAVGTAAIADSAITNAKIANLAVTAAKIANLTVTDAQIASLAVTNAKIADLAVNTAELADAAITTAKIANLAVGNAAIANGAITNAKIGNLAVDTAQLASASVTSAKIENLAVGTAAIAALAVDSGKIKDLAVGTAAIANLAVTNAKIGALAVDTAQIADAAITSAKIENLAVGNAAIANAAITNAKLDRATVNKIAIGTADIVDLNVTGAKIANLAVGNAAIANGAITNAKIGNLAVGSAQIADLAVTEAKIANLAIDTAKIKDGAITNAKIQNLDASKINVGTLTGMTLNGGSINGALGTFTSTLTLTQASGSGLVFKPSWVTSETRSGRIGIGTVTIGTSSVEETAIDIVPWEQKIGEDKGRTSVYGRFNVYSYVKGGDYLSIDPRSGLFINGFGNATIGGSDKHFLRMNDQADGNFLFFGPNLARTAAENYFSIFRQVTDNNHTVLNNGQVRLKFMGAQPARLQVRSQGDTAYAEMQLGHLAYQSQGQFSDRKLKENIIPFEEKGLNAMKEVSALKVYTFQYKDDKQKRERVGGIHDEAPDLIRIDGEETEGNAIDTGNLTWLNTKALQDLIRKLLEKGVITAEDLA